MLFQIKCQYLSMQAFVHWSKGLFSFNSSFRQEMLVCSVRTDLPSCACVGKCVSLGHLIPRLSGQLGWKSSLSQSVCLLSPCRMLAAIQREKHTKPLSKPQCQQGHHMATCTFTVVHCGSTGQERRTSKWLSGIASVHGTHH